jgi:hypothetical protein
MIVAPRRCTSPDLYYHSHFGSDTGYARHRICDDLRLYSGYDNILH